MLRSTIVVNTATDVSQELQKLAESGEKNGFSPAEISQMKMSVEPVLVDFIETKRETAALGISMHIEKVVDDPKYQIRIAAESTPKKPGGILRRIFGG